MQQELFQTALQNQNPAVNIVGNKKASERISALKQQLASAEADLNDIEYNLNEIAMHQRASQEGRIDDTWWDGAIRFGIWHCEVGANYRSGSYPIKVCRWLRHLRFHFHAQRRDQTATVIDLRIRFEQVKTLFEGVPQ